MRGTAHALQASHARKMFAFVVAMLSSVASASGGRGMRFAAALRLRVTHQSQLLNLKFRDHGSSGSAGILLGFAAACASKHYFVMGTRAAFWR